MRRQSAGFVVKLLLIERRAEFRFVGYGDI